MSLEDKAKTFPDYSDIKNGTTQKCKWVKLSDAQAEIDSLWRSLKKADNQIDDLEKEVKELRDFVNYLSDKIEDAAQQNSNYVIETQDIERIKKLKQ